MQTAWVIMAWAILAAGVLLTAWALFGDRSRGRRRCPNCWYDMTGAGLTCPECGKVARAESGLYRDRRRWTWVLVGMLAVSLAWAPALQSNRHYEGALGFLPSSVLVLIADPTAAPGAGFLADHLRHRTKDLWSWQLAIAHKRDCAVTDQDMQSLVFTRAVWPVGTDVKFQMRWSKHFVSGVGFKSAQAWLLDRPGEKIGFSLSPPNIMCSLGVGQPDSLLLASQSVGDHVARFMAEYTGDGSLWPLRTANVAVPFRVVERVEDAITPDASPELEAEVRRNIMVLLSGYQTVLFRLYRPDQMSLSPNNVAFGLIVELLHDGNVVARGNSDPELRSTDLKLDNDQWSKLVLPDDSDGPEKHPKLADPTAQGWTIRVRGDGRLSLAMLRATRFWAGIVDMPLKDVLTSE
jgi:hypothetical protein